MFPCLSCSVCSVHAETWLSYCTSGLKSLLGLRKFTTYHSWVQTTLAIVLSYYWPIIAFLHPVGFCVCMGLVLQCCFVGSCWMAGVWEVFSYCKCLFPLSHRDQLLTLLLALRSFLPSQGYYGLTALLLCYASGWLRWSSRCLVPGSLATTLVFVAIY